jgi:hypothetical protein
VPEGIHETLTVTARSEQSASGEAIAETGTNTATAEITGSFSIVFGAALGVATTYIVHLGPPETGWHIDRHGDPVEVLTVIFLIALLLCALGWRVVRS